MRNISKVCLSSALVIGLSVGCSATFRVRDAALGGDAALPDSAAPTPRDSEAILPLSDGSVPVGDSGRPVSDGSAPPADGSVPMVDSSAPVVDSGTPAPDSRAPVVDSGTPAPDSGGPPPPACYAFGDEAQSIFDQTRVGGILGYAQPMARASGCSAAEASRLAAALDSGAVLKTEASGLGLSAACLSCATAEYSAANPPPVKWGISGSQYTAGAPPGFTGGNPYGVNYFGCLQAASEVPAADAQAAYELSTCLSITCGFETPCASETERVACSRYALSRAGACGSRATAAAVDALDRLGRSPSCATTEGIIQTFCGP